MPLNANQAEKKVKRKKVISIDNPKGGTQNFKMEDALGLESIQNLDPEELIFSLDIGTRTVVGIVGIPERDKLKVIAAEVVEHKNRAMLDGQIHDINQVAEIAREVKDKIEAKLGITLTRVAIAAAGRVLKTCQIKVEKEVEQGREITREMVSGLEMEGIQQAQIKLDEEVIKEEKTQFYCVGYSVINYYLNGYVISSLVGHRGKNMGAEILATFLPHIVVDSLYTVMGKIGLEVVSLTLEPIAAINVTIPKDLRMLNLALVDIGAGTSDIAITRDGSVVAYAMAPIAGDEITERIAHHYLVDFNTSEKIKISLSTKKDTVSFMDILGKKHSIKASEVLEVIRPSIELLAKTISEKILEYNHKAPNAVFLIGGGSQVPGLTELVAGHLKLPKERVVVRGRDIIQNVKFSGKKLMGPEAITPFGIAVTAQMQMGQDFLAVTVNGKKIRLFNSKKLTVADSLVLVGFNPGQLIGRTGKSITFDLNGVKKVVRGEFGKPAEILVNDQPANLGTILNVGDNIKVSPAEDGKSAFAKVSDFVDYSGFGKAFFNGSLIDIGTRVFINGKEVGSDSEISDGDAVQIESFSTIADLIRISEVDKNSFILQVNGCEVEDSYRIKDSDVIECYPREKEVQTAKAANAELQFIPLEAEEEKIMEPSVVEAAPHIHFPQEPEKVRDILENQVLDDNVIIGLDMDDETTNYTVVTVNGERTVLNGDKKQYIFVDIFNFISFDISKPQGNIVLKLNGKPAAFTDLVKYGDIIDIYWE